MDITDQLDYASLARQLGAPGHDAAMAAITARRGFDIPARVADPAALDEARQRGGIEIWRGHAEASPAQGEQAFLRGPARHGLYGSGWGVTSDRGALDQLGLPTTRLVLAADADVVDLDELTARISARASADADRQAQLFALLDAANGPTARDAALRALQDFTASMPARQRVLSDPGRLAAVSGHDAIRVRRAGQPDRYVIINRGKVLAEPMRVAVVAALAAGAAAQECQRQARREALQEVRVDNCMPPKVAKPTPGPCKGSTRGSRSAVGKTRTTGTKPARPRGAPGSGRDLSHLLNMEKIANLPRRTTVGGDARLAEIARQQGFDAPAKLVDAATLQRAVAAGGRLLHRGVEPSDTISADQIHDRSATGPVHFGKGIYGNGMYFSNDPAVARTYGEYAETPGTSRRSVLAPDARTITYPQVLEQMALDTTTSSREHQARAGDLLARLARAKDAADYRFAWEVYQGNVFQLPAQDLLRTDPGAWAMSRGYDAIIVPIVRNDRFQADLDEVVVLNRAALITERGPASRTAAAATAPPHARVHACMPPTVAKPTPGPCPGKKRGLTTPHLPKIGKGGGKARRGPAKDAKVPANATIDKPKAAPIPPGDAPAAPGGDAVKQAQRGRAVGVDYSGDLAALNLDALMALPSNAVGQPAPRLTALGARQGFDALPTLGEHKDLDALEKAGGVRMWRGTKTRKDPQTGRSTPGREFARALRTGSMWYGGEGLRGAGVYTSTRAQTAYDKDYSDRGDDLSVNEMVLHPQAKVADYRTLVRQMQAERTPEQQQRIDEHEEATFALLDAFGESEQVQQSARDRVAKSLAALTAQDRYLSDSSVYAMVHGYDALSHPEAGGEKNYVILNRTALTILKRKGDDEQADSVAASAGSRVQACLPPTVARPQPGPCPGRRRAPASGLRKALRTPARRAAPAQPPTAPAPSRVPSAAQRRGGVRASLMLAETVDEVNQVAAAKSKALTGRDIVWGLGGPDVDIAREHAEGILQGLEQFPGAPLSAVDTFNPKDPAWGGKYDNAFAVTFGGMRGHRIRFSTAFLDDPAAYRLELQRSAHGHLTVSTPTGIALHEFGHVLGFDTQAATASKKIANAMAVKLGTKPSKLVKGLLGDYAKKDNHELLAEAFADVMTRAEGASKMSQAIFLEVERRYDDKQPGAGRRAAQRAGEIP